MKDLPSIFLILWIAVCCFLLGLAIGKEIQENEIYSVEYLYPINVEVFYNKLESTYTCYKNNIEVPCPGKANEK